MPPRDQCARAVGSEGQSCDLYASVRAMSLTPTRSVIALLALSCASSACIEDLDPKSVVKGPRILDMIAERPELNPGDTTSIRVVLAGTRGAPTYRWFACLSADATRNPNSLANFGEGGTFAGCYGDSGATTPLGNAPTATFGAPRDLLSRLETASARFGSLLPDGVLQALIHDVGITVGVAVEVTVDGVTLKGYKRLVVSANARPNANPPSPRVRVNDTWVTAASGEDQVCVPESGGPLRVPRSQNVTLSPDPDEARWFERYRVLTASGELVDRTETAFYSWYATAGNFGRGLTQSPTRDNYWGAPDAAGENSIWVILRDGHGGTSWCRIAVTVE